MKILIMEGEVTHWQVDRLSVLWPRLASVCSHNC